jgi:hypothetical protein
MRSLGSVRERRAAAPLASGPEHFPNTPGSVDRSSRRCEAGGERRSRPAMMRVKAAVAEDGKINEGMALRKAEEAGEFACNPRPVRFSAVLCGLRSRR